MRRPAAGALACALSVLAAAPAAAKSRPAEEPDLSGTYTITSGKTPDGTSYTGTLTIALKTRTGGKHGTPLWSLTWNQSSSELPVRGIGMFLDGSLVAAYAPDDDYGLAVYVRIARGSRGDWMLADDTSWGMWCNAKGSTGREGLRGDREAWEGDYRLHGHTLVDGDPVQPYVGNLSMSKSGDVVHLRWSGRYVKGKDKPFDYPGIGIGVPSLFAAQWSSSGKGGVAIYLFQGGEMVGGFAEGDGLGQETLAIPPEAAARLAPFLSK